MVLDYSHRHHTEGAHICIAVVFYREQEFEQHIKQLGFLWDPKLVNVRQKQHKWGHLSCIRNHLMERGPGRPEWWRGRALSGSPGAWWVLDIGPVSGLSPPTSPADAQHVRKAKPKTKSCYSASGATGGSVRGLCAASGHWHHAASESLLLSIPGNACCLCRTSSRQPLRHLGGLWVMILAAIIPEFLKIAQKMMPWGKGMESSPPPPPGLPSRETFSLFMVI